MLCLDERMYEYCVVCETMRFHTQLYTVFLHRFKWCQQSIFIIFKGKNHKFWEFPHDTKWIYQKSRKNQAKKLVYLYPSFLRRFSFRSSQNYTMYKIRLFCMCMVVVHTRCYLCLLLFHCVCTCFNAEYIWICVKAQWQQRLTGGAICEPKLLFGLRWTWHSFRVVNYERRLVALFRRSMINTQWFFVSLFFPRCCSLTHSHILHTFTDSWMPKKNEFIDFLVHTLSIFPVCTQRVGISLFLSASLYATTTHTRVRLWVQWKFIDFNCNWDSEFVSRTASIF